MAKYRKKPVVIEAVEWVDTKEGLADVLRFCPNVQLYTDCIVIETLEGPIIASPGDYIIKGVAGEFYPCKPDIFAETYEAV